MAQYLEQLLCDNLNLVESHEIVTNEMVSVFDDDIILRYGTSTYSGKKNVMQFLESTARAISSPEGFRAIPIITINTDIPEIGVTSQMKRVGIALMSKLEDYVSWFFFVQNDDNWKIQSIIGLTGMGYQYYRDIYQQREYLCLSTEKFSVWTRKS